MLRSKDKNILTLVLLCAAIGAVATWLVAWSVAIVVPEPRGLRSRPSGVGEGWSYWVGRDFGSVSIVRVRAYFTLLEPLRDDYRAVRDREVPAWSAVHVLPTKEAQAGVTYSEEARGWPLLALRSETAVGGSPIAGPPLISDALVARWPTLHGRDVINLPMRPIWSGFIVDTLLFAVVAFAVMFAPGIVRRNLRRRAGRCEACGYDLRGSESACPECGSVREGGEEAAR